MDDGLLSIKVKMELVILVYSMIGGFIDGCDEILEVQLLLIVSKNNYRR